MSGTSEPGSAPTPSRATLVEFAATFAVAKFVTRHRCGRRAAGVGPAAGPGSRSAASGGGPGAAGREVRAP
jgi:hypothetical protein